MRATENKKCCGKSLLVRKTERSLGGKERDIEKNRTERYCRKQGDEKDMVCGEEASKCER